jgi:hypothetical protein
MFTKLLLTLYAHLPDRAKYFIACLLIVLDEG